MFTFTARRVCVAQTMLSQDVCPSVCTSVRHKPVLDLTWYSVNTAEHILKIFSPSRSPTILGFPYQTLGQYSVGNPLTGARVQGRMKKNHDFRPISRFISEMMQVRAIVTVEGEYETVYKLSNGAISNDLAWPISYISRFRRQTVARPLCDSWVFCCKRGCCRPIIKLRYKCIR